MKHIPFIRYAKHMPQKKSDNYTSFQAQLPMLHMMLGYFRDKLKEYGFPDAELLKCEIALEEVLVNIITHAYEGEVGYIDLSYKKEGDLLIITVRDKGVPFNPLEYKKAYNTATSLEEREVGGLGIILMKEFVDDIQYTRENEYNTLTLIKRLPKKNP